MTLKCRENYVIFINVYLPLYTYRNDDGRPKAMLLGAMRAERETKRKVFVVVKSNEIKIELAVRNQ